MGDWQRYTVDLGDAGTSEVEARVTESGTIDIRGLPGTTFDSWISGDILRASQTVAEQFQAAASEWFHRTKMKR